MAEKHTSENVESSSNDFKALLNHVQQNPFIYAGAIGFIILCVVVSLLYRLNTEFSNRDAAAVYAQALDGETPAERVTALDLALDDSGPYAPLALYMKGEAAFQNQDYDIAREAFEQLREQHPDFEFVPDAVEGLGYILEDQDNLAGALARYKEIVNTWPESFAGRRQSMNIGRCQEKLGDLDAAVTAFKDQLVLFPGSNVALRAQIELNRLRSSNPDLFEDESEDLDLTADVELDESAVILEIPEQ
ncbi:MAG: hypothetical protein COA73_12680 [Candidatus Hydrogenedentota bacterium]|nr:MAG: hypothetical protein COA73_12680 [Candidatus Hydrogenedentota bacterium]